ncbi:MAG: VWA domain-containing protein [Bryobacterales bacterium]|nr:VWA domain-containing protein [Bryobacterales bacterium]
MEFLGLSLLQFLAAAGVVSTVVVALYFLDRRRRRVVVSSFRFWSDARMERHPLPQRRIQQPWSLLLQILALLCLLAALADVRWTANDFRSLDHVLVLDASSAMRARDGQQSLLERAKRFAIRYVRSLPAGDRVMVVASDGTPRPSSGFEEDIADVESAIAATTAGSTALNLEEALGFARQMLGRSESAGDIVYVGGLWVAGSEAPAIAGELENLRVIPVEAELANAYFEKVALKPSAEDPGLWTAYLTVGNRGATLDVPLQIAFGGAPVAATRVRVPANAAVSFPVEFRSGSAGWVDFRLDVADSIRADNVARVELPRSGGVRLQVCTGNRAAFEALAKAYPAWQAEYSDASPCVVGAGVDFVVLDRVAPAGPLRVPALWIQPPASPAWQTRRVDLSAAAVSWNAVSPMSEGLRAKDIALKSVDVLTPATADEVIASVAAGPIALARRGTVPQVAWGFHPLLSEMRFEVTTPLLFANTFRWLVSASAVPEEISIGAAGSVLLADLDSAQSGDLEVVDARGTAMPVSRGKDGWQFFAGSTGLYRVKQGHRESIVSLTLPEVPGVKWEPPKEKILAGMPGGSGIDAPPRWWPWLARWAFCCCCWMRSGLTAGGTTGRRRRSTGIR